MCQILLRGARGCVHRLKLGRCVPELGAYRLMGVQANHQVRFAKGSAAMGCPNHRGLAYLLCLLVGPAALGAAPGGLDQAAVVTLQEIAQGYLQNRESFKFFICRFVIRDGKAPTLEEGVARGPTEVEEEVIGEWVVDGPRERYERRRSKSFKLQGAPGGGLFVGLPPVFHLRDASHVLNLDTTLGGGALQAVGEGRGEIDMTCWNMLGMMTLDENYMPGRVIPSFLHRGALVLRGKTELDGAEVIRFDVIGREGDHDEYYVDPKRGYLPLQIRSIGPGEGSTRGYITEMRQCSGNRWFPTRCVVVWLGKDAVPSLVREFRVVELDTERRPDAEALGTTLPGRMQVHDGIRPGSAMMVEGKVHVDDLGKLAAALERKARGLALEPAESGRRRWPLVVVGIASGAMIIVVAVVIRWARRKRVGG